MSVMSFLLAIGLVVLGTVGVRAGEATVEAVQVVETGDGVYRFDVTVRHEDTGWDHYANAFTVSAEDGTLLGTRVLHHPHVNEQPFTRSLTGVAIPPGTTRVVVRAADNVHGEGPDYPVELPR
ncbi:MAG: hypothetical protein AAGJ94_09410 [Pseudomonadota bacterium]